MKPLVPRVYLLSFCLLSTALSEFSAGSRPEEMMAVPVSCSHSGGKGGGGGGQPPATRRGKGIGEERLWKRVEERKDYGGGEGHTAVLC